MRLQNVLKLVLLLSILTFTSSGCITKNYSKECIMGLSIIELDEDELEFLPKHTRYDIAYNNQMLIELCK